MYKLSLLTITAMVAAGLMVGEPADVEADTVDTAAAEVTRKSNASFLYDITPVDKARPETAISDAEAVRIALERGDEIRLQREANARPNTRTLEALFEASNEALAVPESAWEVTGNWVNLRSGPGTGHAVITQAGLGDLLEPVSETDGPWIEVRLPDGREAWIYGKYLAPRG